MNKTVTVALAAALMVTFGVNANAIKLMVGGKGGFNLADIHGDDGAGQVPIPRIGVGAFGMAEISDKLTIQLEGLWMQKGAEDDVTKLVLQLGYLEFPLTAVATLPVGDYTQLVGFAGPVMSFLIKAKSEEAKALTGNGNVKDELNAVDVGGLIGLGAWFTSGRMMFTADLRWSFGFKKLGKVGPVFDLKNNVISLFVGVAFPIGG